MSNEHKETASENMFDQALVGLSSVGIPLQADELSLVPVMPVTASASQPKGSSFRDELMDEILERFPGLTREKLSQQMSEMGF